MTELKAFELKVHSVKGEAVELIVPGDSNAFPSNIVKNVSGKQLAVGQHVIAHVKVDDKGNRHVGHTYYITAVLG